jgi:hypothetical protein
MKNRIAIKKLENLIFKYCPMTHHRDRLTLGLIIIAVIALWKLVAWLIK